MNRRALLSLVNVAVAGAVLVVWYRYPHYAAYTLYALFGWIVVSFSLAWVVRGVPTGGMPGASSGGSTARLGSGSSGGTSFASAPSEPIELPFCIFCAADLPVGAPRCPACGHLVTPVG